MGFHALGKMQLQPLEEDCLGLGRLGNAPIPNHLSLLRGHHYVHRFAKLILDSGWRGVALKPIELV